MLSYNIDFDPLFDLTNHKWGNTEKNVTQVSAYRVCALNLAKEKLQDINEYQLCELFTKTQANFNNLGLETIVHLDLQTFQFKKKIIFFLTLYSNVQLKNAIQK